MKPLHICAAICLALLLLPGPAFAEVMDKETSANQLLVFGFAAALTAFLAGRYRPRLLWLILPMFLFYYGAQFYELYDPVVGPMIRVEAGDSYFRVSWLSAALPVVGLIAGRLFRRKRDVVV